MKLPKFNFKSILQKLSVLKNNVSLLVSLIIVFVSILIFILTHFMSSGLKKQIQQVSIADGLSKIRRFIHTVESAKQWEAENERLDALSEDANDIVLFAQQTTQREFLNKDIFFVDPNSPFYSPLIFSQFGDLYCNGIDQMISASNGGKRPTEEEINAALASMVTSSSQSGLTDVLQTTRATGITRDLSGTTAQDALDSLIADQICQERAASLSFYVDPADLSSYVFWDNYKYNVSFEVAVEDCWYNQLAYWVFEDIFQTIETLNSGYESVLRAPVKRLMATSFTMGVTRDSSGSRISISRTTSQSSGISADSPHYILSTGTGLTETCTGRYCNEYIDVIHFNATFIVSTNAVFRFMQELCSAKEHSFIDESGLEHTFQHNQISILETNVSPIDLEDENHLFYSYGDQGVVKLDIVCEYVFVKEAYEDIKPELVKQTLSGLAF